MKQSLVVAFCLVVALCLLLATSAAIAEQTVIQDVKIRRHKSADKRVLVDKWGTLIFDDTAHKLIFTSEANDHIAVGYDDIEKVIFEDTHHMRGGMFSQVIQAAGLPGLVAGTVIATRHVTDYWFYLEYKDRGQNESALLDIPKESSDRVIEKAKLDFGPRVIIPDFSEKGAEVNPEDLKALKTKQTVKVDRKNHPLPEVKPDKATLIVVCPPLAGRYVGTGFAFRLHANDEIVAVNKMGTYSFAYLEPGRYHLISQAENANGFDIDLEAGHQYYFLQNIFQRTLTPNETSLSRNSPELVSYFLDGSYFSDWKPQEKKQK